MSDPRTAWKFSDDPDDPCAFDVVWVEDESDPMADGYPIWPDGSVPPHIYRFTHRKCMDAVNAYVSEAAE